MLQRLVDDGNRAGRDLSSLRSIAVGGAPLYVRDLAEARTMFGPIVTQFYGQGEAPMLEVPMSDAPNGSMRSPVTASWPGVPSLR